MKRKLIFPVIALLFFISFSLAFSAEFWGSKNSDKYHYPTCKWAQKIISKNLVKFSTPEEAVKKGYVACKVCKPPVSSKANYLNGKNIIVQMKIDGGADAWTRNIPH